MNPRFQILVLFTVVVLPLGLSHWGAFPPRSVVDELASGAGMLGFVILLVVFVLSGRFRTVSARIGIDVSMRFHQLLARTALAFALIHPFLYQTPFNPPLPWDSTRQLTLSYDLAGLATGFLAWLLLGLLVFFAIFREGADLRYETWRLTHGLGAAALAGLLLHHTLSAGRYSQAPVLAGFWVGMSGLALASLAYIYLVKPVLKLLSPWTVQSVRPVGLETWEVTIAPHRKGRFRYQAGQFAWLSIGRRAMSLNENPFSIASAPASGDKLQFIIKELGDFTRTLGDVKPGTRAYVDGPHGHLVIEGRSEPGIALIAGGVGIAPILGILRQLHSDRDPRPSLLVYGNRVEEQIVCREELDRLTGAHATQTVYALYQPPPGWNGHHGMCDADLIRKVVARPEMRKWLFVLCGPPIMMEVVERALLDIGVPSAQILSEKFKYD